MGPDAGFPAEESEGIALSFRTEAREILLLGGDGFLGGHIARELMRAGRRVTTLSRGRHAPVEGAERLIADRRDAASLAAALTGRRFDMTVDLAAYEAIDVELLWRVPGAALGRTVMISTGQVYLVTESGRRAHREPDSGRPLMRDPGPGSVEYVKWKYGVGKRAAEAVFMSLRRHHGVRGLILRLPVVQGEGDPTLRLWAWLERMLDGSPVFLPDGARRATRFVEVNDLARLIEKLAGGASPRAAVYNLAAPRVTSLRRFLVLAARAAGASPRFIPVPAAALSESGLDLDAWPFAGHWSSVLDPSRARRDLGFNGTPPEDYLPRLVRRCLEHRPDQSHFGYAQRAAELAMIERLEARPIGSRGDAPAPGRSIA